jgi:hypothetical protein
MRPEVKAGPIDLNFKPLNVGVDIGSRGRAASSGFFSSSGFFGGSCGLGDGEL